MAVPLWAAEVIMAAECPGAFRPATVIRVTVATAVQASVIPVPVFTFLLAAGLRSVTDCLASADTGMDTVAFAVTDSDTEAMVIPIRRFTRRDTEG